MVVVVPIFGGLLVKFFGFVTILFLVVLFGTGLKVDFTIFAIFALHPPTIVCWVIG